MKMMIEKMRQAFPNEDFPGDGGFYSYMDGWQDIYECRPRWRKVKRAGLNKGAVPRFFLIQRFSCCYADI